MRSSRPSYGPSRRRLAERGKDARDFPTAVASYATRAVKSGRTLCGTGQPHDLLSPTAQARHGFAAVSRLTDSPLSGDPVEDALIDNTQTPPDDQAAFRIDFQAWRQTHAPRDRSLIDAMMQGEGTFALAEQFRLSPSRVSRLRRRFHNGWLCFTGEKAERPHAR